MTEELPFINNPVPLQQKNTACKPDPQLCLTPDVRHAVSKTNARKVRFEDVRQSLEFEDVDESHDEEDEISIIDINALNVSEAVTNMSFSSAKEYIPQLYTDSDESTSQRTVDNLNSNEVSKKAYCYLVSEVDQTVEKRLCNKQVEKMYNKPVNFNNTGTKPKSEKGIAIVVEENRIPMLHEECKYALQNLKLCDRSMEYNTYSRPEYNSSLRIGEEIRALKTIEPDVMKVISEKLKSSGALRTIINEKASLHVNRSSPQYRNLVSIDVTEEMIKQRKEIKHHPRPTQMAVQLVSQFKEPDLMEFFTDDLQKESVDLPLDMLRSQLRDDLLRPVEGSCCYDIYQHNRMWDGW